MVEKMSKIYVNDGFIIIRNAISKTLHRNIQSFALCSLTSRYRELIDQDSFLLDCLGESERSLIYEHNFHKIPDSSLEDAFHKLVNIGVDSLKLTTLQIQEPIWQYFVYKGIPDLVLNSHILLNSIKSIIGSDLQYILSTAMVISIPPAETSRKNYLFKKYHQELWSGCALSSLQSWTPIFQSSNAGQLDIIPGSHKWGLVPNRNREPLSLPDHTEIQTDINYTDCLLFHPLLLHRSSSMVSCDLSRLSMPITLRNFRYKDYENFESRSSWKTFHISPQTEIEMSLGNSYLSPFRLLDSKPFNPGEIGRPGI